MEKKGLPVQFAVCRYSQTHKVPKIELEYHEVWCLNKSRVGEDFFFNEIRKTSQARALAQAAKGVDDTIEVKKPEKPHNEACPAALIGYMLPPEDRMLPRQLLWDKLNKVWAEKSEKLAKEKYETIKSAYMEPIERSPPVPVPSTAAAIAQFDEEKKKEEQRKETEEVERKKRMVENCNEFWAAFEKRKQEAALAAKKKMGIEEREDPK